MVTEAAARVLDLKDYGIKVGGPADFVAVEAGWIAEAIATRPPRKWVMKAARISKAWARATPVARHVFRKRTSRKDAPLEWRAPAQD